MGYLAVHTCDAHLIKRASTHLCNGSVQNSTWELSHGKDFGGNILQVCKNTSIEKLIEKHHLNIGQKLLFTWQERKLC